MRNPWILRTLCLISVGAGLVLGDSRAARSEESGSATPSASSEGTAPSVPDVDRVEITGVTVFSDEAIETTMEIETGDRLERSKIVRTAENLQKLYRIHGYEQAGIQSRLLRRKNSSGEIEDVLEFSVTEGLPTRVAQITFIPEGLGGGGTGVEEDANLARHWKAIESSVRATFDMKPGGVFDQEKLAAGRRAFQESFGSKEYVGVRVEEVKIFPGTEPKGPPGTDAAKAARWVNLEIRLRLGDRVSFGFRGNHMISENRLAALVEEERAAGLGKDYIASIKAKIESEYKNLGYAKVQVKALTFEKAAQNSRHVTFFIDEGPRVRIASVDFDGNSVFSNDELKRQFELVSNPLTQHGYYSEREVQGAAELVVEWMKARGYLSAKLVTVNAFYMPKRRADQRELEVKLVIYVYEWDRTLVQSVEVSGARSIPVDEIKKMLGVQEGQPLNLFAFNDGLEAVKAAYRAKGYLGIKIANEGTDTVVKYSQESRVADIALQVEEGPQYRVSRIEIEGLGITKDIVVRRELAMKEGEILEEPLIAATELNLRRLGIFSMVVVRATDDPSKPGFKVVKVALQEADPGVVAGGPGYRSDIGIRAFGEVGYTNLWGLDHTIAFNTSVNRRLEKPHITPPVDRPELVEPIKRRSERDLYTEFQLQLSYVWPWFALPELTYRPSLAFQRTRYVLFDARSTSFNSTWERKLLRRPNLSASFTYSFEEITQENTIFEEDEGKFRIGSITPSLRLDMRDNPLSPTSGLLAFSSFELAHPLLFSDGRVKVGYTRWQLRTDYYLPLYREIVWYMSFRTGFERNFLQDGAIPLSKLFTLGGVGSLRGFGEQALNLQKAQIRGTASYVNYRFQLDLPFSGALRFSPFLDAGNLQQDTFSFGNLRWGSGFGFRYLTPVGPVNFDVGLNLFPRVNEDTSRFYLSIGVI